MPNTSISYRCTDAELKDEFCHDRHTSSHRWRLRSTECTLLAEILYRPQELHKRLIHICKVIKQFQPFVYGETKLNTISDNDYFFPWCYINKLSLSNLISEISLFLYYFSN